MATSAASVNSYPTFEDVNVASPNLAGSSYGVVMNAMGQQNRVNDILGISSANTAFNEAQADNANTLTAQWYNQAMDYNAAEAAKNRDWQTLMSNTAHQREVRDLIAAGLNPVLSASGGNGATVGSGASASVQTPSATKASADTSGSAALVNLLGNSLDAMTKIANTNTSAMANMAIADKYNNMNKYLGELNADNSFAIADLYGKYGLAQAEMSGSYNLSAAATAAAATRYAAFMNNEASHYASDTSRYNNDQDNYWYNVTNQRTTEATKYAADKNYQSSKNNAWLDYQASKYRTDVENDYKNNRLTFDAMKEAAKWLPFLFG